MTDPTPTAPTLPGFEVIEPRPGAITPLEREAREHVRALIEAGRLNAGHRLLVALILDLARTVGMGASTGKAAGVAMASRQLLDAMAQLPALEDEREADEWADVVRALSAAPAADDDRDEP